eukprot:729226-Lingulodinium_polyedra.AAC.1
MCIRDRATCAGRRRRAASRPAPSAPIAGPAMDCDCAAVEDEKSVEEPARVVVVAVVAVAAAPR